MARQHCDACLKLAKRGETLTHQVVEVDGTFFPGWACKDCVQKQMLKTFNDLPKHDRREIIQQLLDELEIAPRKE